MSKRKIPAKYRNYIFPKKGSNYYYVKYQGVNTTRKSIDDCIALIDQEMNKKHYGNDLDRKENNVTLEIALTKWIYDEIIFKTSGLSNLSTAIRPTVGII